MAKKLWQKNKLTCIMSFIRLVATVLNGGCVALPFQCEWVDVSSKKSKFGAEKRIRN